MAISAHARQNCRQCLKRSPLGKTSHLLGLYETTADDLTEKNYTCYMHTAEMFLSATQAERASKGLFEIQKKTNDY